MKVWSRIRPLFFPLLLALTGAAAAIVLALCLRNGEIPSGLLNSRIIQSVARRAGVEFRIGTLHTGCFQDDCGTRAHATGIQLGFRDFDALNIGIEELHWCSNHPLSVRGLTLGSPVQPRLVRIGTIDGPAEAAGATTASEATIAVGDTSLVEIDRVEVSTQTRSGRAQGVRYLVDTSPAAALDEVAVGPVEFSESSGTVNIDAINATGLRVRIPDELADEGGEVRPSILAAGNAATLRAHEALGAIEARIAGFRDGLFNFAVILMVAFLVLKVWTTAWTARWQLRLALGAGCALAPLLVYFFGRELAFGRLLLWSAAASAVFATAMALVVYRHGERWYQRWEPFTVDLLAVAIILPLAVRAFDFGTPFEPPQRIEIARSTVSNIEVSAARRQCDVGQSIAASISAINIEGIESDLPDPSLRNTSVRIAAVDIPGITAALTNDASPERSVFRLSESRSQIDEAQAGIDWGAERMSGFNARVRVNGTVLSETLIDELRNIRPLMPFLRNAGGTTFSADLRAEGSRIPAQFTQGPLDALLSGTDRPALDVRARIGFDLESGDAQAAAVARFRPLGVEAAATGNPSGIQLQSIRALSGSGFAIRRGSGRVAFGERTASSFRLEGLTASTERADVRVGGTTISASFGPACAPLDTLISAALEGMDVTVNDGTIFSSEAAEVEFGLKDATAGNALHLDAALRGLRFESGAADSDSGITASLPAFDVQVDGTTSQERIPRLLDGNLRVSAGASDMLVGIVEPLAFTANLWEVGVTVPEQNFILRQDLTPRLPAGIGLSLFAEAYVPAAAPDSIDYDVHLEIPSIPLAAGSGSAELKDIRLAAHGGTPITFESGWNSVRVPVQPWTFCFESIPRFQMTTQGQVADFIANEGTERNGTREPDPISFQPCTNVLAESATDRTFRFSGAWPSLRVEDPSGKGLEIGKLDTRIHRAMIDSGRVTFAEIESAFSGIKNLDGSGLLNLASRARTSGQGIELTASLLDGGNAPLLDSQLNVDPGRFTVVLTQPGSTEILVQEADPFLRNFGIAADGVTPKLRLGEFRAEALLDQDAWSRLNAKLSVLPGPVASVAFATSSPLRSMDVSLGSGSEPAAFEIVIERAGTAQRADVTVSAETGSVAIQAAANRAGVINANVGIGAVVRGSLYSGSTGPQSRIGSLLSDAVNGLMRQAAAAQRAFADDSGGMRQPSSFSWQADIKNAAADRPFLGLGPERAAADVAIDSARFAWRPTGENDDSAIATASNFAIDLGIHEDRLIADTLTSLRLEVSPAGRPGRRFEADVPALAVFSPSLVRSGSRSARLWDASAYSRFWSTYAVKRAHQGDSWLGDLRELKAGALSLQQITAPLTPLRAAVGFGDSLQLQVPFTARPLFGTAEGTFDAELRFADGQDGALLDSRIDVALRNIQAGAAGMNSELGHAAFIEDELDGDVAIRIDRMPVSRELFERLGTGGLPALDPLSLAVGFRRSERNQSLPGVIQVSNDFRVNTMDRLLNSVIRELQLTAPPRTLAYRNLNLDFRVDEGKVSTENPWLSMEGFGLFSTPGLALEGSIRLFGGRNGEPVNLRDLLGTFGYE